MTMGDRQTTILVVDDGLEDLRFLSSILIENNYYIQRLIAKKIKENVAISVIPDLILLDIATSEMGSYEVLHKLKSYQPIQDVPIIIISFIDELSENFNYLNLGATDYITKPFRKEEVLIRVQNQLTIGKLQKQLQEQNTQVQAIALQNKKILVAGITEIPHQITEYKGVEKALQASTLKLRKHNLVLTKLAKNQVLYQGDLSAASKEITEAGANNIGTERTSIWLYDEIGHNIQCLDLFEQSCNKHSQGFSLSVEDYPAYFQALQQNELIAADNAYTDPRTKEFSESYLLPFNITSVLYAPIRLGGKTVGVLCLEAVGLAYSWTLEDQNFARSLGNLVSLALEARERQRAQAAHRISEQKLASAFRSSPDPIALATFPETRYIEVNDSFCRLFGYSRSQVIGRTNKELNIWVNVEEFVFLGKILQQKKAIRNHEVDFRTSNGEIKTTLFSAEMIEIDGQEYILSAAKDITERKQAENESRLLLLTTQAMTRAIDVKSALKLVLRLICHTIGWDFGEAWIVSDGSSVLKHSLVWFGEETSLEEFWYQSQTMTFAPGVGLPGRVWQSRQPEWIEDVSHVKRTLFLRSRPAKKVGLKAGFGVPILAGNEVLAVLIFFKRTPVPVDKRLLMLLGAVATQLGGLIQRKLAEEALREGAEREKAIAQVIQRMRQTLDIETIFAATTQQLRQVLDCDRVVVYHFDPCGNGEFVSESVEEGWISLIEEHKHDLNLTEGIQKDIHYIIKMLDSAESQGDVYSPENSFRSIPDIYKAGFDSAHISLLERFQAKAYITVPILCGSQLWGLLASYQNSSSREWKTGEINIVVQIGNQLGVALQQAQLLAQTQRQSQELQSAFMAASAANRAKSEFLANMSHELRTPLNAILGFTQIMSYDTCLSREHQENLAIINRAGEHLLHLINNILEMSKIEAGKTTLNMNNFDLILLLNNLKEMLSGRAAAKGLKLIFEFAPNLPQYVQTDESKLRQVLLNILGNAIKFTTTGSVNLRVGLGTGDKGLGFSQSLIPNPQSLIFEIQDTGPGISSEELELLFEAFGQTESGRKSQQGTGLGLAISRKYVQLMGGDIHVSSTLDLGSIFTFDIQIALISDCEIQIRQTPQPVIGLAPENREYRILVVDDIPDSRLLLVKLLTSWGFAVQEAANGQEAIAQWSKWHPHLIFMDMRMPVMDGYEATKKIKAWEQENRVKILSNSHSPVSNAHTIIIALTANAFEEQREAIMTAGCDDLINKPFQAEKILEKIRNYLGVKYLDREENHPLLNIIRKSPEKIFNPDDLLPLLSQMSDEWIKQIYNAAAQCSDDLILHLIEQIPPEHIASKECFINLALNFQFEKIMKVISIANVQNSQ